MSTNKTKNYRLHSWEPEDNFLRTEINENFTAVDDAIAAEAERAQETEGVLSRAVSAEETRAKAAESALSSGKADKTTVDALTTTVSGKADSSALTSHTGNTTAHITAAERTAWNGKQAKLTFDTSPKSGSSNPVTSGGVYTALAAKADSSTVTNHTGNGTVHITAAERAAWNAKVDVVFGSYIGTGTDTATTINLGFTPRAVIVANANCSFGSDITVYGGMYVGPAVTGAYSTTSPYGYVVENGFLVKSRFGTNCTDVHYYMAIK